MAEHTVAHLDCTAGVAGDMLLGALIDAGARLEAVRDAVTSMGVEGLSIDTEHARRGGMRCLRALVSTAERPDRERHLADVLELVGNTTLSASAARYAERTFGILAEAEGAVHGLPPDQVHFHEVGAYDALADVVGCAAALDDLGMLDAEITTSALAAGSGTVLSAHGRLAVPPPAVARIVASHRLAFTGGELSGERSTPTGAALVAALAAPGSLPDMSVRSLGCGGGHQDSPDRPNITRLVLGARQEAEQDTGDIIVVETTVDDMDPRVWPSVLTALREAGALDCWTTSIVGRHGRPGQLVTALCPEEVRSALVDVLFRHTSTLGVRWAPWHRTARPRRTESVQLDGHRIAIKLADTGHGSVTATPELADAQAAANELERPLKAVLDAALARYWREACANEHGADYTA